MNLQPMPLKDWIEAHPEVKAGEGGLVDCERCEGDGEWTCDECGTTLDCEDCGGTGKVLDGKPAEDAYQEELRRELIALKRWQEGLPITAEEIWH